MCIMATLRRSRRNIKLRDEISRLPDELLVCILSSLSLKEAVASSIVCRRWRYLWTFTSKLDFDASNIRGADNWWPDIPEFWEFRKVLINGPALRKCWWKYVGWVDDVLGLHDESAAVEELRISFGLCEVNKSDIDRWLRFALAKKVVRLELNLVQEFAIYKTNYDYYTFPYQLLCDNESHSWGFKQLRELRMDSVIVSDGGLEIFLRSCPLLDELYLSNCRGLSTIKIVNPSSALKRLTISCCYSLQSVEIRDSKLVQFMYSGRMLQPLLHKNVPLLVTMLIGGVLTGSVKQFLSMFSSCLPQLEKLTIEKVKKLSVKKAMMICSTVKMSNLKQLEWMFWGSNDKYSGNNLMPLTIVIGALPLLQRLVLRTYADEIEISEKDVINSPFPQQQQQVVYTHLKQLEFVGYHGMANEFEFVVHILENSPALEEVIIDPAKGKKYTSRSLYSKEDTDAFGARAKDQLTSRVPSTAILNIL